MYVMTRVFF